MIQIHFYAFILEPNTIFIQGKRELHFNPGLLILGKAYSEGLLSEERVSPYFPVFLSCSLIIASPFSCCSLCFSQKLIYPNIGELFPFNKNVALLWSGGVCAMLWVRGQLFRVSSFISFQGLNSGCQSYVASPLVF